MADKDQKPHFPQNSVEKLLFGGYLLFGVFGGILIATDSFLPTYQRVLGFFFPIAIMYLIFLCHASIWRRFWRPR